MLEQIDDSIFEEYENKIRKKLDKYLSDAEQRIDNQFDMRPDREEVESFLSLMSHLESFDNTLEIYRRHLKDRNSYCFPVRGKQGFYVVDWDRFIDGNPNFITNWVSRKRSMLNSVEFLGFNAVDIGIANSIEEIQKHIEENSERSGLKSERFFVCIEKSTDPLLFTRYKHVGEYGIIIGEQRQKITRSRIPNKWKKKMNRELDRNIILDLVGETIYIFRIVVMK